MIITALFFIGGLLFLIICFLLFLILLIPVAVFEILCYLGIILVIILMLLLYDVVTSPFRWVVRCLLKIRKRGEKK